MIVQYPNPPFHVLKEGDKLYSVSENVIHTIKSISSITKEKEFIGMGMGMGGSISYRDSYTINVIVFNNDSDITDSNLTNYVLLREVDLPITKDQLCQL